MSATFILIYIVSTLSASGGMATGTAEFDGLVACESAGRAVDNQFSNLISRVRWFCAPQKARQTP